MSLSPLGSECRAAMTLQFNIEPLTKPRSGSLKREADDTLRATNLAVTSVVSIDTGAQMDLSTFLDFQSGSTGYKGPANFFLYDKPIEEVEGTTPTSCTSITGAQSLSQKADGSYLFTMRINYGYVGDAIVNHFGTAGAYGWTGLLSLNIAKFDPFLASAQITSGSLVLTSSLLPVPAGEEVQPNLVPEPASCGMAGLGLLIVGGLQRRRRRDSR